jgi:hypothetical protein
MKALLTDGAPVGTVFACNMSESMKSCLFFQLFDHIVTCVRFPWQLDVGALSHNNGIVQHCCVSLATQQLKWRAYQQAAW